MFERLLKTCQIGQKVKAQGKLGEVVEVSDKVKVKFDDGSFDFFEEGSIEEVMADSTLKGICPYCKGDAHPVLQEKYYGGDKVYQCMKCQSRFSTEVQNVITHKSRTHCKACGKLCAKHVRDGIYKCESCDNQFQLN
jgi:ribosomal protein L37AE/L43A